MAAASPRMVRAFSPKSLQAVRDRVTSWGQNMGRALGTGVGWGKATAFVFGISVK